MSNIRILLVEDNAALSAQLGDYLIEKGFIVDFALNGKQAFTLLETSTFDVVILDLMLPDIDGLEICQHIKATSSTNMPILMLTAKDSLSDKVLGFDAGTDDYLTKPYELEEVAIRCVALSRRNQLHSAKHIAIGELELDLSRHIVIRAKTEITLSATDFQILKILAEAYPNAVTRTNLIAKIWGDDAPDSDTLRSHIYTLRNALDKPFDFAMLKTIHGVGFKLVDGD